MSGTEKTAARRRDRLLMALSGGLVGAGGALLGRAVWRRRSPRGHPVGLAVDEASGRGMPETPPSPQAVRNGFETEDMSASLMATLSVGLGLAIAVSVWLMVVMLHGFGTQHEQALTAAQTRPIPTPLPHLQAAPLSELATLQMLQRDRLTGYGWADPGHERARLPIGVAIRRTVGQSLDASP